VVETRTLIGSQLYVRVHTSNYAFYALQATSHSPPNVSSPVLPDEQVRFYLAEDT
jgi:hypothetical protein